LSLLGQPLFQSSFIRGVIEILFEILFQPHHHPITGASRFIPVIINFNIGLIKIFGAGDKKLMLEKAVETITLTIWLMLPAYIPNPAAALFGGGLPIDFRKYFLDGKRILGDGKTFRGLICGTACGIAIGIMEHYLAKTVNMPDFGEYPDFIKVIFLLSFGALFGDLLKSFLKRRLGYERGAKLPVVDQLDLVLGAWLLAFIFAREWFLANYNIWIIATAVVITPVLHRIINVIGYKIGAKKEPW
jgi:CDP-2,3-bis-(O-geranylgeranyl)-sn-glycerol synthase